MVYLFASLKESIRRRGRKGEEGRNKKQGGKDEVTEREREGGKARKRAIFPPPVQSGNAHTLCFWGRLKPGIRKSTRISDMDDRYWSDQAITCCLAGTSVRSWIQNVTGTSTSIWDANILPKWWFNTAGTTLHPGLQMLTNTFNYHKNQNIKLFNFVSKPCPQPPPSPYLYQVNPYLGPGITGLFSVPVVLS